MDYEQDWKKYFSDHVGHGYLSTSDAEGRVNTAVYARPHVQPDGQWAFIMNEGRSFSNVQENPHVVYAFDEAGLHGYRFYLDRHEILSEGDIFEKVNAESRKPLTVSDSGREKFVVLFNVVEIRALVGG